MRVFSVTLQETSAWSGLGARGPGLDVVSKHTAAVSMSGIRSATSLQDSVPASPRALGLAGRQHFLWAQAESDMGSWERVPLDIWGCLQQLAGA